MNTIITKIRTKQQRWGMPMTMTMEQLAEEIRSARYAERVMRVTRQSTLERMGENTGDHRLSKRAERLPYIIFSSRFGRRGVEWFEGPTGLILLSIDCGDDPLRMAIVRRCAMQIPQTAMVFRGSSGRTLKVVADCTPTGKGSLPTDADGSLRFIEHATRQAARYYASLLGCSIPVQQASLTYGCRMSHDAEAYYQPSTVPLPIVGDDVLRQQYPLAHTDSEGNFGSRPDADDVERERTDFYTCLAKAREECSGSDGSALADEQFVNTLATLCRRSGLQEETSVLRTLTLHLTKAGETVVRKIFRSVYQQLPEGKPWSQMSRHECIAHKVKEFFERRYELRYNTMKGIEEFRPRSIDYHPWQPLSERDIRRIAHEQMLDAGAAWSIDIDNYARSSIAPPYNPVHEFLAGCGSWDGKHNYIEQLARRVPCEWKEWPLLFHRWFLGMVATWQGISRDYSNAVVPMLVGHQGVRKSTFCKLLLPHSLREYYIDDVKLDNAEQVERMLARMALVNIDEYNAKTVREQAKIKRILTERDVQVRRMRSDQYLMLQRMASFIATTNERQPLTDTTGNRRYLCVEVTGTIDTETPLNYRQLYAQALWELAHGKRYYMSRDEELAVEQHNTAFLALQSTETILTSHYEPMPCSKQNFMRAVDILSDLQKLTRGADRPTMDKLVKALKAAHFQHGAQNGIRGWYARKRNQN